jgi:hypothetical protein
MLKKLVAVFSILAICMTVAMADTIKGAKITKIDDKGTITVEYKEKKEAKTAEVKTTKDTAVVEGKDKTKVDDGVKGLKVGQVVTIEHKDGTATEILLPKKKK